MYHLRVFVVPKFVDLKSNFSDSEICVCIIFLNSLDLLRIRDLVSLTREQFDDEYIISRVDLRLVGDFLDVF